MSRLLHLSDLHYGRDREDLEAPLLETIADLSPDLVAVSGDLTQRARKGQFARAAQFLDRLAAPWLSVPGNHDTPLDNIAVRMLSPWHRYRRAISPDLEPVYEDDGMVVVGVNTVNRFSWQRGRLSTRRIARACEGFETAGDRNRVAVLHHPLQHGPEVEKRLMRGANKALHALSDCGAQIVLSGHLHNTVVGPMLAFPQLLFVQAGTSLSSRVRGEPNTFNLLDLSRDGVQVETWGAETTRFERLSRHGYRLDGDVWRPEPDGA